MMIPQVTIEFQDLALHLRSTRNSSSIPGIGALLQGHVPRRIRRWKSEAWVGAADVFVVFVVVKRRRRRRKRRRRRGAEQNFIERQQSGSRLESSEIASRSCSEGSDSRRAM